MTTATSGKPADPLAVIAGPPPPVDARQAVEVARQYYGLSASARELVSERDRNFRLQTDDGRSFVLKIANAAEDAVVTDFQVRALLHIAAQKADLAVPEIVPTRDGEHAFLLDTAAGPHVTRLVTWLDGVVMRSRPVTPALARHFGSYAARLARALAEFRHPGADHSLLWDMRRAGRVRELTAYIGDEELRRLVADRLDRFLERQLPLFPALRSQVVHNDLNPENVLLAADDDSRVAGVIDFGDMVASPLVVDVAVAASYLRKFDGDPLD
jgi:Ser/Thr protein kinase RdoA (MazF antagonist)